MRQYGGMRAPCDTCGAELGPDAVTVNGTRQVCAIHFRPPKPPADERKLHRMLRNGERLEFDHEPPLQPGEVYVFGQVEVTIVSVRRTKADRWTVHARRKVPSLPRNLRVGPLPWTAETRVTRAPTPSEIAHAREDSAYTHRADVLDAGEALSDGDYRKLELAARLKQADAIRAEVEEAA